MSYHQRSALGHVVFKQNTAKLARATVVESIMHVSRSLTCSKTPCLLLLTDYSPPVYNIGTLL